MNPHTPLSRDRSMLLVIDLQTRLLPAIHDQAATVAAAMALLEGADVSTDHFIFITHTHCEEEYLVIDIEPLRDQVIACNNEVNVSLDENCEILVTSDMLLEGADFQAVNLIFTTDAGDTIPNPISGAYLGQNINFKVENACTLNSCWGIINLEAKRTPFLTMDH